MDQEIHAALAEIRAATAKMRAQTEETRAERIARASSQSDAKKAVEQARRDGEHGKDWKVIQQKIDLGQTTLDDVLTGVDHSPEAAALRASIQKLLPQARAQFADLMEKQVDAGAFDDMKVAQERIAQVTAEASRLAERL
jgi:hypothetical protein